MSSSFAGSLDELLRGFSTDIPVQYQRPPQKPESEATPAPTPADAAGRPQTWFAGFAEKEIIPLFRHTVGELTKRGVAARCGLDETDGQLTAELVIAPPGLPHGARPPRLAIVGVAGRRAVEVNYTGTFPYETQSRGTGAEIGYDTIYPSQIEERLLEFVRLATRA